MTKKAPTIYDIAGIAGVSASTVSRVLNGRSTVDPEMRERVEAAVNTLRYRPNRLAQQLILNGGQTLGSLGCVLPDITSAYFAKLFQEIETYAFERGYTVFLGNSANNFKLESTYLQTLAERQIDGLLLLGGRANVPDLNNTLVRETQALTERLPIVTVNGDVLGVDRLYSVCSDERAGTEALLTYLQAQGHTRIAFLGGLPDVTSTLVKLETYQSFLGTTHPSEWVQLTGFNPLAGQEAMRRIWAGTERPTAVLCINDLVAAGVLKAAQELGVHVPYDLSVTGFDDTELAELVTPSLTSVNHNYSDLARRAVDVLLSAVNGDVPLETNFVPTRLVIRESVLSATPLPPEVPSASAKATTLRSRATRKVTP